MPARAESRGLAWRLLRRQWQAGELRLVFVATLLAAALATLLTAVGDRLEQAFVHRAAEMLGGDLVLSGSQPPLPNTAATAGLARSVAVDFNTMLARPGAGEEDPVLLVAARAVEDNYPLRGELRVRDGAASVTAAQGPARGEIWVEPRVADELGLRVGDSVVVGVQALRVAALVQQEPDRGGGFSGFNPRVLFNQADLAATGVVQPGSRVRYRAFYAGNRPAVEAARLALEPRLRAHEELVDAEGGDRRGSAWLGNTLQFFSLVSLLGIVLCAAAIGMAADRHARRLQDTVALLRTFGMAQAVIARLLLLEIFGLALVAGAVGTLLGYAAQALLVLAVGDVLPGTLPDASPRTLVYGLLVALITLPAFALPALARLRDVPPAQVLRRLPLPPSRRTGLHYVGAGVACALLLLLLTAEPETAGWLLVALALLLLATWPLGALPALLQRRLRARLSLPLRLAGDRLARARWRGGAQLLAFALILTSMTLATLLRGDLLRDWQRQLPADTPNVFALNLLPHERDAFIEALAGQGIAPARLYPVTPGRLLRINDGELAERIAEDPALSGALDRDLILTEAATEDMAPGVSSPGNPGTQVSVERKLAEQLGLDTGDTLLFLVAGREVRATVSGFRDVDWNTFQPNFYMVLSPGTLLDPVNGAPYTWLTSFYTGDVGGSVRHLRAKFPAITLLEVGPLVARLQTYSSALADGAQFVLALVLAAALVLLVTTVTGTLDERLAEAAVLRVLGARRVMLRQSLLAEFALLGVLAGLLAMLATEAARALLLVKVMDVGWSPALLAWLLVPAGSALLLAATGWLAARRSLAADASAVLRDT